LGHAACLAGHTVLFTTAVDILNVLAAAQTVGRLKAELQRFLKPGVRPNSSSRLPREGRR
jgi:DNA replication protein DnaC